MTITLVTGHIVRVSSNGGALLLNLEKGEQFLIPNQAQPYLAAGVLDRQLFNITDLVQQGFADYSGLGEQTAARIYRDGKLVAEDAHALGLSTLVPKRRPPTGSSLMSTKDTRIGGWRPGAPRRGRSARLARPMG